MYAVKLGKEWMCFSRCTMYYMGKAFTNVPSYLMAPSNEIKNKRVYHLNPIGFLTLDAAKKSAEGNFPGVKNELKYIEMSEKRFINRFSSSKKRKIKVHNPSLDIKEESLRDYAIRKKIGRYSYE